LEFILLFYHSELQLNNYKNNFIFFNYKAETSYQAKSSPSPYLKSSLLTGETSQLPIEKFIVTNVSSQHQPSNSNFSSKDKFAGSPLFSPVNTTFTPTNNQQVLNSSPSHVIPDSPLSVTPKSVHKMSPLLLPAEKIEIKQESSAVSPFHTSQQPALSTPTSVQIAEKLGLKIKGCSSTIFNRQQSASFFDSTDSPPSSSALPSSSTAVTAASPLSTTTPTTLSTVTSITVCNPLVLNTTPPSVKSILKQTPPNTKDSHDNSPVNAVAMSVKQISPSLVNQIKVN